MKLNRKTSALLSAAAISGVVFLATGAVGQDAETLAPQGDFALTFSFVDAYNAPPVMIGENQMAQAVNYVAHVFNDAGTGSFLNYAVGNCATFQTIDVAANTIEISGYCSYRDADGDRAFEHFASDGAVALDGMTMSSEWVGGTGKYADLGGSFTTEAFAAVQNGEATLVGGRKTGSYTIAGGAAPASAPATPAASAPATPAASAPATPATSAPATPAASAPATPAASAPATPAASAPATPAASAGTPAAPAEPDMATLIAEGGPLFNRNCSGCHGTDGTGDENGLPGPKLVGNSFLASAGAIIGQIMVGNPNHGMPPFADRLSDREIAAIGTYVRNSWGNSYGIVPVRSVTIRRPQ